MRSAKANRFSSKLWMHSLKEKAQSAYHSDDLHRGGEIIPDHCLPTSPWSSGSTSILPAIIYGTPTPNRSGWIPATARSRCDHGSRRIMFLVCPLKPMRNNLTRPGYGESSRFC